MKVLQIVQLRDVDANLFDQPRFVESVEAYVRDLRKTVNTPDARNAISAHPDAFEAYHLGTWIDGDLNEMKEGFHLFPNRIQLCRLSTLLDASEQEKRLAIQHNEPM